MVSSLTAVECCWRCRAAPGVRTLGDEASGLGSTGAGRAGAARGSRPANGSISSGGGRPAAAASCASRLSSQHPGGSEREDGDDADDDEVATDSSRPAKVELAVTEEAELRWPRMNATATTQARVIGMRNFQPKRMNWS